MTKEEATNILKIFNGWNTGQKSIPYAFEGTRTAEDDIYDERRKLIKKAYEVLNAS